MTGRTSKSREKLLSVITVAVIIGTVVFAGVVRPGLNERQSRLRRMHQLELKLTRIKRDVLEKDRIDRDYARIEPLIAGTGTDLQEKSKFARELHDLFSKQNVQTRTVTPLPILNEEFYRGLAIKIEMTGNIKDVLKFIFAVETYSNPIRIEWLDLKTRETTDDVHASFRITKVVAKAEGAGKADDEKTGE